VKKKHLVIPSSSYWQIYLAKTATSHEVVFINIKHVETQPVLTDRHIVQCPIANQSTEISFLVSLYIHIAALTL